MLRKLLMFAIPAFLVASVQANECVILLHGLAKTSFSMEKISNVLQNEGYFTINYDYPSRESSIENLAETHIDRALERCPSTTTVHFVTHSMGGLLVRQYLDKNKIDYLGKVVMLGPPNQGSQIIDKLHGLPGLLQFAGPASLQLGTKNNDLAKSITAELGPATFDLGIIAGNRSVNLIFSSLLPDQDDGKVTVENTMLSGMKDHITLPVTHPFMMRNDRVISQIKYFLKFGEFYKPINS